MVCGQDWLVTRGACLFGCIPQSFKFVFQTRHYRRVSAGIDPKNFKDRFPITNVGNNKQMSNANLNSDTRGPA